MICPSAYFDFVCGGRWMEISTHELDKNYTKCILMCFRYVKKFMMLILELTFVFHKSKQALTKATLNKLSTTINSTEISLCFNEQFCDAVVTIHA